MTLGTAPVRSSERTAMDLLDPISRACVNVAVLNASLPTTGRIGSGTRRTLRESMERWADILAGANAAPLPPSRSTEEPMFVTLGQDGEGGEGEPDAVVMPLRQYTPEEIESLGQSQGVSLTTWVEQAGESWRARGREVATAYRAIIRAVSRRVGQLAGSVRDEYQSATRELRDFLRRWVDASMQIHRDMMGALGRAAYGAGMAIVLLVGAYAVFRRATR